MKSIKQIGTIQGKTVLLRADFNVPIEDGKVRDAFRIKKAIPTIEYLVKKGARVLVLSHAGDTGEQTLAPIATILQKSVETTFVGKTILTREEVNRLPFKEAFLLENIRREPGEKKNHNTLAKQLAAMADYYVNDAFSVSHRPHASIVSVPKFLPSFAGLQLEAELKHLGGILKKPKRPFIFILGGAKFATKLPLLKKFLKEADAVFVAGALMNNFFKGAGYPVGRSLVEEGNYGIKAMLKNPKLLLPVDVEVESAGEETIKSPIAVLPNDKIMDIGPESIKLLEGVLKDAKLVLWNGPTGAYELGFDRGTKAILKLLANGRAETIIGGGDTAALVSELNLEKKLTFVSTGGGATLEFLATGTLPGIKALG